MVTRGQIWAYIQGSRQYRILIISNDEFNGLDGVFPWGLRVARDAPGGGLLVRLDESDPLPGASVDVTAVVRIDRTALRENLGFIAPSTLNAVEAALRDFLNLP